jgi:N-glycosylase/DNA lyase
VRGLFDEMYTIGGERRSLNADFWERRRPHSLNIGRTPFDLGHTLMSGQAFRWREDGQGFAGVVRGNVLRLKQEGRRVLYDSFPGKIAPPELRTYLGLDEESEEALRSLPKDPFLQQTMRNFRGTRVLRQEPWETLVSFIISANNNIARIKRCIESACRAFGREIAGAAGFHAFPAPEALAKAPLRCLREECNLGYRDAYVKETARIIARMPDLLSEIGSLPYPSARKKIMRLPGVGPKVADCVLLYSMGKFQAFPVDVWIKRVMEKEYKEYFGGETVTLNKIRAFAQNHFAPSAGYAQLYLFQYAMTSSRR